MRGRNPIVDGYMNFGKLFEFCDWLSVKEALYELYIKQMPEFSESPWGKLYDDIKKISSNVSATRGTGYIEFIKYKELNDYNDKSKYVWVVDMILRKYNQEDQIPYSLCYTPWKEIARYKINTYKSFGRNKVTYPEAIASALWEMSWFGYDEEETNINIKEANDAMKKQRKKLSGE